MRKPTTSPDGRAPRKPYVAPKLVKYGDVRALTQVSTMGSSEGSSGSGVMKPSSDRRLKENVAQIGTHPFGFGLYLFDYKADFRGQHGAGRQFGVMADEVESVMPEAVSRDAAGYRFVDYGMLGIRRTVRQDSSA